VLRSQLAELVTGGTHSTTATVVDAVKPVPVTFTKAVGVARLEQGSTVTVAPPTPVPLVQAAAWTGSATAIDDAIAPTIDTAISVASEARGLKRARRPGIEPNLSLFITLSLLMPGT